MSSDPPGIQRVDASRAGAPPVWALVLNYGSYEDTLGCVEALRRVAYPQLRILVLDNASPDGSGPRLQQQLGAEEFVQLPVNTGYAGGNNTGMRMAIAGGARYVFILNPDARVAPGCVAHFVELCEADRGIGAVNSIEVERDGVTIDPFFASSVMADAGIRAQRADDPAIPSTFVAPRLFGAAFFLPVHAIEKVGGFDPLYFAYWEEFDLCRRLQLHGFKLLVTRETPVVHLRTNEHRGVSPFVVFLRLKSTYLERLKDPAVRFTVALRFVARQFWRHLRRGGRPNEYPFNLHDIGRGTVLKAGWWVVTHLHGIFRHRQLEIRGRAHV
ncbi:MAG: glycosyltransferase family 2 protein [Rubrivivax sp.]|nr:glycosyltransferase family 2 protein [Rubrivivax sp.]